MNMLNKIIGSAKTTAMMKRLRGGPQSMLPMSPGKGSGVPSLKGLTPKKAKGYVTPRQNPALSLKTGGTMKVSKLR